MSRLQKSTCEGNSSHFLRFTDVSKSEITPLNNDKILQKLIISLHSAIRNCIQRSPTSLQNCHLNLIRALHIWDNVTLLVPSVTMYSLYMYSKYLVLSPSSVRVDSTLILRICRKLHLPHSGNFPPLFFYVVFFSIVFLYIHSNHPFKSTLVNYPKVCQLGTRALLCTPWWFST